jgi:hypothetical protein
MRRRFLALAFLASTLSACAGTAPVCAPGLVPRVEAQIFFGRNIAGRERVSDDDWRRFVDEEVTPRFPDGLSVTDVEGQYRNEDGTTVRERSKELIVVVHGSADDTMKLNAIRDAYKRRFDQEAVLLVEAPICGSL